MAVPLQVGGALKDIIEAPDMEGYRQIDSKEIPGPVYEAIPGGAPPPDVLDDYSNPTQATGSWSRLATSDLSNRAAQAGREVARH